MKMIKKYMTEIVLGSVLALIGLVTVGEALAQDIGQWAKPFRLTDGAPTFFMQKGEVARDASANKLYVKTGGDGPGTNGYGTLNIDAIGNAAVGTVTLTSGTQAVTNSVFNGSSTKVFTTGTGVGGSTLPSVVVTGTIALFTGTGALTYSYFAVTAP